MKRLCLMFLILLLGVVVYGQEGRGSVLDKEKIYRELYLKIIDDGKVTGDERESLEVLRVSLGLSESEAQKIEATALEQSEVKVKERSEKSGKWLVYAQNVWVGFGIYGFGIPYVFKLEDIRYKIGIPMISMGASVGLTYYLTKGEKYPYARSFAHLYGGSLANSFDDVIFGLFPDAGTRFKFLVKMIDYPLFITLMDRLYLKYKPTNGEAFVCWFSGYMGSHSLSQLYTYLFPKPIKYEDFFEDISKEYLSWKRWEQLSSFLGHPLGIYLQRKFLDSSKYTVGDGIMLYLGDRTGYVTVLALDVLLTDKYIFRRQMIPFWLAGEYTGIWFMHRFLKGKDYSISQSVITGLTEMAAFFTFNGVGIVLKAKRDWQYALLSVGGIYTGFFLSTMFIEPSLEVSDNSQTMGNLVILPGMMIEGRQVKPSIDITWKF